MITVYKKGTVPKNKLIFQNDIFFNKNTALRLDSRAADIIWRIDHSEMLSPYTISSRFDGSALNIDKLSTGCKTALNVLYNQDKVFDVRECGDNALDVIYSLPYGNIFCDYPLISFDMEKVKTAGKKGVREVDSYEELKEWWTNENETDPV